jgi:hypothetical protein
MAQKLNRWPGALMALLALASTAVAVAETTDDGEVWRKALPNTTIHDIRPEPRLPGMYEIIMGDKVVYGDATGRYLVFGRIYDVQTNEDITQGRIDQVTTARRIPWDSLPLQYALRESLAPRDAPRLAILHANDCGWCRRLYHDVKSTKDENRNITRKGHEFAVDVRFMILAPEKPTYRPEKDAEYWSSSDLVMHELADHIICGGSPELNLQNAMQEGFVEKFSADLRRHNRVAPGGITRKHGKDCDSRPALAAVREFAKKHRLAGTPVLISGDGRIRRGYLPPDELMKWLNEGKDKQ